MKRWVMSVVLAVAGFSLLAASMPVAADNPLRRRLSAERSEASTVSRFERTDGGGGFILDRTGSAILFLGDDDDEVLVLEPRRLPGGGNSLVTDWDEEVLRISSLGGATFYAEDAPEGVIADTWEPARALRPERRSIADVIAHAEGAASRLQGMLGRPVQVDYGATPRDGLGVVAEALTLIVAGIEKAKSRDSAALAGLERVRIVSSGGPGASFDGQLLEIRINPLAGHAGRPSSERIAIILVGGAPPS